MIHCTLHSTQFGEILIRTGKTAGRATWGRPRSLLKPEIRFQDCVGAPENRDVIGEFLFIDFPSMSRKINRIEKKGSYSMKLRKI